MDARDRAFVNLVDLHIPGHSTEALMIVLMRIAEEIQKRENIKPEKTV